jgi:hypothetical protein
MELWMMQQKINRMLFFILVTGGMSLKLQPSNALEKQYELKEIPAGSELNSRDRALEIDGPFALKREAMKEAFEGKGFTNGDCIGLIEGYVGDTFSSESEIVHLNWQSDNIWKEDNIRRGIIAVKGERILYKVRFRKEQGSVLCEYIPSLMLSRVLPYNPLYSGLQSETHDFNHWKTVSYSTILKKEILRSAALWKSLAPSRGQAEEELAKFPEKVRVVSIYPGQHEEEDHVVLPFWAHPSKVEHRTAQRYTVIAGPPVLMQDSDVKRMCHVERDIESVYSHGDSLFIKFKGTEGKQVMGGDYYFEEPSSLACLDRQTGNVESIKTTMWREQAYDWHNMSFIMSRKRLELKLTSLLSKDQYDFNEIVKFFNYEQGYKSSAIGFEGGIKACCQENILIKRFNVQTDDQVIPRKNYESHYSRDNEEVFCRFGKNVYLIVQTGMPEEGGFLGNEGPARKIIEIYKGSYQEQNGKQVVSQFEKIGEEEFDSCHDWLDAWRNKFKLFTSPSEGIVAFHADDKICFFDFRTALHEKERQARLEEPVTSSHEGSFDHAGGNIPQTPNIEQSVSVQRAYEECPSERMDSGGPAADELEQAGPVAEWHRDLEKQANKMLLKNLGEFCSRFSNVQDRKRTRIKDRLDAWHKQLSLAKKCLGNRKNMGST